MKKLLHCVLLTLAATFTASAYDFAVENSEGKTLYFNLNPDGTTCSLTFNTYGQGSYSGVVNIPATVNSFGVDFKVTAINFFAFFNSRDLTEVIIPSSITAIGQSAFKGCTSLTSITIPSSVVSIADMAFSDCPALNKVRVQSFYPSSMNLSQSAFDASTLANATLYVPRYSSSLYQDSDEWGRFGKVVEFFSGDVTNDGSINVSDVTSIVDYILDPSAAATSFLFADVNGDGSVNISDVSDIVDAMVTGSNYTMSKYPEAIFLIGQANGWITPDVSNYSRLQDWRLFSVTEGVYVGTFYVAPDQANFRFYSSLNGWDDGCIGIGYGDYGMSCEFNEYGIYSSGIVYGKSNMNFNGWEGGYMTFSVDLKNMWVVILKPESAPDPEYLLADGRSVQTKLYFTSTNTYVGQNYYGAGEATFKIGNLGVEQFNCEFPDDDNNTFSARLIDNGAPIRFSSWPGGVLEIKVDRNSRMVYVKPLAMPDTMTFESVCSADEVIHVAKGDNTLISLANVYLIRPLRADVAYEIAISGAGMVKKIKGVFEDGRLYAASDDINNAVREIYGFTSKPVDLNLSINAQTSYHDVKLADEFVMTVKVISDDKVSFLYTPSASNSWNEDSSNVLFSDDGVKYSGFAILDQGFWIKDKENSKTYGDRYGSLYCGTGAQPIEVFNKGLYYVNVNLSWESYDFVYVSSIGVIGSFCGWSQAVNFTRSSNSLVWEGDVTFSEGDLYVIQINNSWDAGMLGGSANCLTPNGGNLTAPGSGKYHLKLDISKYPYTLTYTKK